MIEEKTMDKRVVSSKVWCAKKDDHRLYHAIGKVCPCCPWFGMTPAEFIGGQTGSEPSPTNPPPQQWLRKYK